MRPTSPDAPRRAEPAAPAPAIGSFKYCVSVQLYLPPLHAILLRQRAMHHHDSRVRRCGESGTISALRDVAVWTTERASGEELPMPIAMTARDLDAALRAMEQPSPFEESDLRDDARTRTTVAEIERVLREALRLVTDRSRELDE